MRKIKGYLKGVIIGMLLVGLMLTGTGNLGAAEDVDMNKIERHYTVKVFVDTAENEVVFPAGMGRPFIALDRTYVPYRILAERMGAEVGWVDSERKVKAENEKNKVEMVIGSQTYKTNGIEKQMEVSPFILSGEGRSYVPARFLTEGLGYKINFAQGGKVMFVCSFTKGQTDAEMEKILKEIVEKNGGNTGTASGLEASEIIVEGNHYIIGSEANEEFTNDKYIIRKRPEAIGGGSDVLVIWPLTTDKIQVTCTSHPELNNLDYYGSKSDMTRPCTQYQLSGNGYAIELYRGMEIELKTYDGDIFKVKI